MGRARAWGSQQAWASGGSREGQLTSPGSPSPLSLWGQRTWANGELRGRIEHHHLRLSQPQRRRSPGPTSGPAQQGRARWGGCILGSSGHKDGDRCGWWDRKTSGTSQKCWGPWTRTSILPECMSSHNRISALPYLSLYLGLPWWLR